ncbi:chymotrypsinogen A-like [Clavelina lepadiformis]|uniref:Peptidase S1 domain-containing protein n=1 Tax=Clavelina lepadiformis TaxID=159417 RepID=A0ABP0FA61_CLALP
MYAFIGILVFAAVASADNRIVGGADVTSTSFAPWQASLQVSGSHFCGGSLINKNFVMSACHCRQTALTVVLGTTQYKNPGQSFFSTNMFCHPSYNSQTIDYDYSIIELQSDAVYSSSVQPIVVASKEYLSGTQGLITGWGKTSGGVLGQIPDNLQYAYTYLISKEECQQRWGSQVTDRMQCIKADDNSGCNGDSGGPLAVNDAGTWVLVGNTSWGSSRCSEGIPAAWSKNSVVYDWIKTNANL